MLDKDTILSIISQELGNSGFQYGSASQSDLEEALDLYLGNPLGNEVEGRSQIVSTDVADTIEWILPQIMKSFTQNNDIVTFDPVKEGDETQAELESQYVYEVLMKQNDGFIILHQFVKDALMQRNGILKVFYAKSEERKVYDYTGISEEQYQALLSKEDVELLEMSDSIDENLTKQKQIAMESQLQAAQGQVPEEVLQKFIEEAKKPVFVYDVKIAIVREKGQVYVDNVPPESFRINSQHNSINCDNARFTAHIDTLTQSEVIKEFGLPIEMAEELPGDTNPYQKAYRFTLQNEDLYYDGDDTDDPSQRLIEIAECYMQMDIDETGISKLMKITVAGGDNPSEILSVEEVDCMPWVTTTTFLMSHKFEGLSITDRIKQIMLTKTALWRNVLDNLYLQNNQRNIVDERYVNMDDLLVSRPGGVIRTKKMDSIMPLVTPQIGQEAYAMMEYLDTVRAGRTGVDAEGAASPGHIGDRVGSQGVDRLMNAKEELVGLIIRVVAETGVKPLCIKIRNLLVNHIDAVHDFQFRGQWHQINPCEWPDRIHCTVRVGTGTGNREEQIQAITMVLNLQEKIITNPEQAILDQGRVYNAINDLCKWTGLVGADRYFIDPASPQGQEMQQAIDEQKAELENKESQIEGAMAESQIKLAEAEQAKAQAQMANTQLDHKIDMMKQQMDLMKAQHQAQTDFLRQQLEESKAEAANIKEMIDAELRKYDIDMRTSVELTRIESAEKTAQQNQNFKENKDTVSEQS